MKTGKPGFVVVRTDWDEYADEPHAYWENHTVKGAFHDYDDARAFVEEDAGDVYDFKWKGRMKYSGKSESDGIYEGIFYELHKAVIV